MRKGVIDERNSLVSMVRWFYSIFYADTINVRIIRSFGNSVERTIFSVYTCLVRITIFAGRTIPIQNVHFFLETRLSITLFVTMRAFVKSASAHFPCVNTSFRLTLNSCFTHIIHKRKIISLATPIITRFFLQFQQKKNGKKIPLYFNNNDYYNEFYYL